VKSKARKIGRLSIEDVARKARVGLGTASRALAGAPHVSERARKAVWKAAGQLGYRKNPHARALRGGSVPSAIFLCCNRSLTNTFHGAVVEGAALRLNELGWQTVLVRWDTTPQTEHPPKILHRIGSDVLIFAGITNPRLIECCTRIGAPIILSTLGFEPPNAQIHADKVAVDELLAFQIGMKHMLELGHRRIGLVIDPHFPWSVRELEWWKQECSRRGVPFIDPPPLHAKTPDDYPRLGFLSAEHYLLSTDRPTALMVTDDLMSMGVARACLARGLRVPADVSIVGKGGYPFLDFLGNPWSTITMNPDKIGPSLAELAEWRRLNPKEPPRVITIDPAFVDHGSATRPQA
jgi:LacI family transcriptional regulator